MYRLARNDARCLHIGNRALFSVQRALAVDRVAQTVNNAAQKLVANRNVHDGLGALDRVAFFDRPVITEDDNTNVVNFQVQRHAANSTREFDHFTGLDCVQTVNAGDTVADAQHATDLGYFGVLAEVFDLVLENR